MTPTPLRYSSNLLPRFQIAGLILLLATLLTSAEDNITFRLSFDRGLEAEVAKGNPTGKYLREGEEPHFVEGLKGKKGFLTGKPNQCVQFAAKDNVPQEEGSVVFWMKGLPGVTWNKVDKQHHCFFYLHGTDGNIILYKFFNFAFTWLFGESFTEDKQRVTHNIPLPNYTEDEWRLYAFTWKGQKVSLYLDAKLAGAKDDFQFPLLSNGSLFMIGESVAETGEEERVMSEFTIYNKELSDYDLAEIYRTQGEISTSPKDQHRPDPSKDRD